MANIDIRVGSINYCLASSACFYVVVLCLNIHECSWVLCLVVGGWKMDDIEQRLNILNDSRVLPKIFTSIITKNCLT